MRPCIRCFMKYAGIIVAAAFVCNGIIYNPLTAADKSDITDPSIKAAIAENYGRLPLSFEANNGQVDDAVKFLSRGNGYTLYLTPEEAVLSLKRTPVSEDEKNVLMKDPQTDEPEQMEREVVRLKNIGTNPDPRITGLEELPGKSNYFIGNDPDKWRMNVFNYAKVKIEDVYPGIDLVYYGSQRQLEFDWIVAPGVDPNAIRLAVEGNADLKIDAQGNLILDENGELFLNKPLIYQERDGDRTQIAGRYVVQDNRQVGIQVDKYNTALQLVIDPVLSYSTYLGGEDDDEGLGIAVDVAGNAYVTGITYSTSFPTANPFQASNSGIYDAFVTKLNSAGNALVYSTYLGGNEWQIAKGIAVDASGNAYVTGWTQSPDFPIANPFQASYGGGFGDAYITKLNASGDALAYSTYFGGEDWDYGIGIAVDPLGNAYVTGQTASFSFPTGNPVQANLRGEIDAFVLKLIDSSEIFFPEITVGGGWSTTFALCNTGSTPTSGNLILTDQQENPLVVTSSELGTGSSFPFVIPPGGTVFLNVDLPNPADPTKHGWARAEFWGGSLSGVATYKFSSEGIVTALAGVLPSQPTQFATITVNDDLGRARTTAYAIANPTDLYIRVKLCLVDTEGNVVDDTVAILLAPGEQIARYLFEDFAFSEFKGTAVLRAQGGKTFVAVGLKQNQALFTVTPVEAGKAPHISD